MADVVEVDLIKTKGRLIPPGMMPRTPAPAPKPAGEPAAKADDGKPAPAVPGRPAAPPDPEPAHANCKHCGSDPTTEPSEPSKDDVAAFQQAVWRDERFEKRVTLFGGAVEAAFRFLTPAEEAAIETAVVAESALKAGGRALTVDEASRQYFDMSRRYDDLRLGVGVASLRVGTKVYERPSPAKPATADLNALFDEVVAAAKQEPVYQAVRWQYLLFYAAARVLVRRAADPNFFPATGAAGPSPASPSPGTRG